MMAGFGPVCRESRAKEGRAGGRENNLDSDYQPASTQEGGNVSMATETTSQCHVTATAVSRQTSGGLHLHAELPESAANLCGETPGVVGRDLASGGARFVVDFDILTRGASGTQARFKSSEAKCVKRWIKGMGSGF